MKTNAMDWKLGISIGDFTAENFAELGEARVDAVELSSYAEVYEALDWKTVEKLAGANRVGLWSVHLPFYGRSCRIDIAAMDAGLRNDTFARLSEIIKRAGDIGTKVAVIHPGLEPTLENERAERLNYAAESLAKLCAVCADSGMQLAVEDLPRTCLGNHSDDFKVLLSGDDRLRVVFDTNHLLIQKNIDFVRALGEKIITLHVSDYDFLNERHWLPYEGKIDWVELVTALEEVGYAGPWLYELGKTAPKSITRRELTYADFRRNYEACISKTKPEILGVPVESECMANAFYNTPFFGD